ncbi:MAG: sigma-54-dependent Fis family transcriptional regulator, partial [Proteobacteria bacterium]|nr:sigma-54-dependent Fis family transcriptional regulator [Pseudomonadota bacterium]
MNASRTPEGQMFSDPGNDAAVMAAWERFLDGGGGTSDALRGLIDGSWQRCQQHNVDPDKRRAPPPVAESTLESMKLRHSELLQA